MKVEEGSAIRVTRSSSNNSFRSFKSRKGSYEPGDFMINSQNIFGLGDNGETYQWLGEKGFLKEESE